MSVDFKLAQPAPRLGTRDDPPESRYAQARDALNPAEIRADWFPGGASEAMIAKYSRRNDETFQASFTSGNVDFVEGDLAPSFLRKPRSGPLAAMSFNCRSDYAMFLAGEGTMFTDMDDSHEVTLLLSALARGDEKAGEKLVPLVYDELRRLAGSYMRRERTDHTLQATALVHEAYLKLVEQRSANWQSRAHFFGVAAQLMRRILIDHARAHLREKRGGGHEKVMLNEALIFSPERSAELLAVDEALGRLARLDDRQARVVQLRFFGGLSVEEAAEVLGVSRKTVKRDWSVAKAWLHADLKDHRRTDAAAMADRKGSV